MTTSQEWAERLDGFVPGEFDGIPLVRGMDRKAHIDRVLKSQPGLTRSEAAEQLDGRLYDARQYLRTRQTR